MTTAAAATRSTLSDSEILRATKGLDVVAVVHFEDESGRDYFAAVGIKSPGNFEIVSAWRTVNDDGARTDYSRAHWMGDSSSWITMQTERGRSVSVVI